MSKLHNKILLVEGENDVHVVDALIKIHGLQGLFEVKSCHDVEGIKESLKWYVGEEASRTEAVGVMLDADKNIEGRWDSIRNILAHTGMYAKTKKMDPDGLVLEPTCEDAPRVGVWIMPNNQEQGMLEDFVAALADQGDPLMVEAEAELTRLEAADIQRYKTVHRPKAKIHTYLAWQNEPGYPMGTAITARVLDPHAPSAQRFVNWLNRVFN